MILLPIPIHHFEDYQYIKTEEDDEKEFMEIPCGLCSEKCNIAFLTKDNHWLPSCYWHMIQIYYWLKRDEKKILR